jgi:DNA-binding NtrC family response regulator
MGHGKKIMVVNDTSDILELFREILTDEGYEVITHSFEIHTLEPVEAVMPDLVIVDQIFGEEKPGWQLIQLLRMTRRTENIPIVVCSGALKQVQELESHLKNMQIEVVAKPFRINDLLGAVERALDPATQQIANILAEIDKDKTNNAHHDRLL